jgi:hypothetical protein
MYWDVVLIIGLTAICIIFVLAMSFRGSKNRSNINYYDLERLRLEQENNLYTKRTNEYIERMSNQANYEFNRKLGKLDKW